MPPQPRYQDGRQMYKDDYLVPLINSFTGNVAIAAGIFYSGKTQRPRLLTTGSIVDGIAHPARFNSKNYPPELINIIRQKMDLSTKS